MSVYFGVCGNLHIKNQHIISGKHAQELYADFYMLPKASDTLKNVIVDSTYFVSSSVSVISVFIKLRICDLILFEIANL